MVAAAAVPATGSPTPCSAGWRASPTPPGCASCACWSGTSWAWPSSATSLQLPQSTVSRHLKVLADQGWVTSRAQGTTHLYRMTGGRGRPGARRLWLLARDQTEGWATVAQDQLRLDRRLAEREPGAAGLLRRRGREVGPLRARALRPARFTQAALLSLLPPDWVVADLGCGTGPGRGRCSRRTCGRVIGVDQSAAMLKAAQQRTAALGERRAAPGEPRGAAHRRRVGATARCWSWRSPTSTEPAPRAARDGAHPAPRRPRRWWWTCCATTATTSGGRWGSRASASSRTSWRDCWRRPASRP